MDPHNQRSTTPRRKLGDRLSLRLAVALCLGAGVVLVAAGAWNLRLQRSHLTHLLELQGTRCAEVIRRSTREAMMRNDPAELDRIIQTIASQPQIERIRVFDKQGRISISTRREEVGTMVDVQAEQCVTCHRQGRPLENLEIPERTRIFELPGGGRNLGVITPIRNETTCAQAACHAHPGSRKLLGVLDVQLSLAEVEDDLARSERQMMIGLAGVGVGVLALAWWLTWRMVLQPARHLTEATSRVATGDFSTRIPVASSDEIGEMTAAWNDMVERLGDAHDELAEWNRTLEHKVEEKTVELRRAHQRMLLVEKMASLGKLAAVVAHEINNPLTGIGTYARLLRKRYEEAADAGDATETARILRLIEEESLRCGNIVRNLLLFSRTPGARFAPEPVQPLLERCRMLLNHKAELQGTELRLEVEPESLDLVCDAAQIQQMILALAANALEAIPEQGRVTLATTLDRDRGEAVLRVADTGRGIPPEELDRIFEPFYTTKEESNGSGLGLAVVYGIVKRHRGTVEVDSEPGAGTTVTVRLPLEQPAEPPPTEDAKADDEEVIP
jgi:two-component system NtrC family sensor kinase